MKTVCVFPDVSAEDAPPVAAEVVAVDAEGPESTVDTGAEAGGCGDSTGVALGVCDEEGCEVSKGAGVEDKADRAKAPGAGSIACLGLRVWLRATIGTTGALLGRRGCVAGVERGMEKRKADANKKRVDFRQTGRTFFFFFSANRLT